MADPRWFVNVDHVEDSDLEFMGWFKVADNGEFSIYRRPYDGEEQSISNDVPRYMVLDDVNDAMALSSREIIIGPDDDC